MILGTLKSLVIAYDKVNNTLDRRGYLLRHVNISWQRHGGLVTCVRLSTHVISLSTQSRLLRLWSEVCGGGISKC